MEYIPCHSPFNSHFARANDQLTHWAYLTNVSRTWATCSLFNRGPRINDFTLPLSFKFPWDTMLLPLVWLERVLWSPLPLIDRSWIANRLKLPLQINWNSTPFGFLGVLWCIVQASYGTSWLHHLLRAPPPIQFLFIEWNRHMFLFKRNGTGQKCHRFMPPTVNVDKIHHRIVSLGG